MFLLYTQNVDFECPPMFSESLADSGSLVACVHAEAKRLADYWDWEVVASEDDAAVFFLVDKKGARIRRAGYIEVSGCAGRQHFLVAHTRPVPTILGSFPDNTDDADEILDIALRKLEVLPPVYSLSVVHVTPH